MRIISFIVLLGLLAVLSACQGSAEQDSTSTIQVYNDVTDLLIADSDTRGSLTLNVGDTRQLRVMRRVTDDDEGTTTTDVTVDADYNTGDPAIATVGGNDTNFAGLITATGLGTTTVNILVRDPEDPTKNDSTAIDINVVP